MATYYTNEDGFIIKKENDKTYILSWSELEFNDTDEFCQDDDGNYDDELAELMGLKDILDSCIEISKQEVKKRIEEHVLEIALNGKKLIESL